VLYDRKIKNTDPQTNLKIQVATTLGPLLLSNMYINTTANGNYTIDGIVFLFTFEKYRSPQTQDSNLYLSSMLNSSNYVPYCFNNKPNR